MHEAKRFTKPENHIVLAHSHGHKLQHPASTAGLNRNDDEGRF